VAHRVPNHADCRALGWRRRRGLEAMVGGRANSERSRSCRGARRSRKRAERVSDWGIVGDIVMVVVVVWVCPAGRW